LLKPESAKKYSARIVLYKSWCIASGVDIMLPATFKAYAQFMRVEEDYMSSTIFSVSVILSTWYRQAHNLMVFSSFLKKQIRKWAEDDDCKQADTFSMD
jgi:hypothetical protein